MGGRQKSAPKIKEFSALDQNRPWRGFRVARFVLHPCDSFNVHVKFMFRVPNGKYTKNRTERPVDRVTSVCECESKHLLLPEFLF